MANKTVGDLNFKVGADASGVVSGLQPAINAWKTYKEAADSALKPGNTAVDATALAAVEREKTMLAQITGVGKAGYYDPSRLSTFAQDDRKNLLGLLSAKASADESAKAVEDAEKRKIEAIKKRGEVESRISQAMALQRAQTLAQFTAKSDPYDPSRLTAFAQATNHATQSQKQLWAAQIQTKVAANMVAYSLGTNSTGAIGAVRNLGNTTEDSLKGYKRFQLGVQNAGYQVQDFFVQVASGQSKLVALAQQLPQLLGPIGMYGALAGVAVSIGAVAYQTLSASKNADTAAQKFRTLKEATDALAESQRQLSLIGKDEFAEMPFFEEQLTKAQTQLDAVKKQIDAEKKSALAAQKSASASIGIVSPGAVGSRDIKTNADQEKRLAEAEFAFTEAQRKVSELKEKQFERDAKNENALIDIAVKGVSQKLQADFMRSEELKKLDEFRDKKNKERMDEVKVSRDKVIIGLQSRMPEPLRVNAGNGFSYGQSVGGRGADILDLTRRMLNALEKLVELERYDLNPI